MVSCYYSKLQLFSMIARVCVDVSISCVVIYLYLPNIAKALVLVLQLTKTFSYARTSHFVDNISSLFYTLVILWSFASICNGNDMMCFTQSFTMGRWQSYKANMLSQDNIRKQWRLYKAWAICIAIMDTIPYCPLLFLICVKIVLQWSSSLFSLHSMVQ